MEETATAARATQREKEREREREREKRKRGLYETRRDETRQDGAFVFVFVLGREPESIEEDLG